MSAIPHHEYRFVCSLLQGQYITNTIVKFDGHHAWTISFADGNWGITVNALSNEERPTMRTVAEIVQSSFRDMGAAFCHELAEMIVNTIGAIIDGTISL